MATNIFDDQQIEEKEFSCGLSINRNFNTSTRYRIRPLILFSLKPANIEEKVRVVSYSVSVSSNTFFYAHLFKNLDISGFTPSWVNDNTDAPIRIDNDLPLLQIPTPTFFGGTNANNNNQLVDTMTGNTANDQASSILQTKEYLGVKSDNVTPEIWALAVICFNSNETIRVADINLVQEIEL